MLKIVPLAVALFGSLMFIEPAQASPESTYDQQTVSSLQNFALTFTGLIDLSRSEVHVTGPAGEAIEVQPLHTDASGSELVAPVKAPLPPGIYKVRWHVVSQEGMVADGTTPVTVSEKSLSDVGLTPSAGR